MFVWRSNNPRKIVVCDKVLEASEHRHVDYALQTSSIVTSVSEDIADGRLRDDDARETRVPGPKSLFLEKSIFVLRKGDLDRTNVRSLESRLPEDRWSALGPVMRHDDRHADAEGRELQP